MLLKEHLADLKYQRSHLRSAIYYCKHEHFYEANKYPASSFLPSGSWAPYSVIHVLSSRSHEVMLEKLSSVSFLKKKVNVMHRILVRRAFFLQILGVHSVPQWQYVYKKYIFLKCIGKKIKLLFTACVDLFRVAISEMLNSHMIHNL